MIGVNSAAFLVNARASELFTPGNSRSNLLAVVSLGKPLGHQFVGRRARNSAHSIRSAADDSSPGPANDSDVGRPRLLRTLQSIQNKIAARYEALKKNLPVKLFSFLVGFYCATAYATVIGQTGDWDVLSAALTVAVVEGIGALMYKTSSLRLVEGFFKDLIVVFNYWKAGLSLGLFLDSFKY